MTPEEAEQAAGTARRLIAAAGELLPQLPFFGQDQQLRSPARPPHSDTLKHDVNLRVEEGRQFGEERAGLGCVDEMSGINGDAVAASRPATATSADASSWDKVIRQLQEGGLIYRFRSLAGHLG